ncbi:hypothetical protein COU61_03355 [Candidatus Pacearchaeota archaeon CG10_big_fil_rev_8_21_14_0_10_35_13]|nr:MAG: hypothetical protein COU61_03355 [Candidatus Pacearchaeota archaeon CG10_big_fil_rev_8_21_14_0_10_35_13]
MGENIRHNCGFCVAKTLHDAYSMIKGLQHRGREAAGIAAIGDKRIDVVKWSGGGEKFDLVDLHKILSPTKYHTFLGHVRYATKGRKDRILEDAHPHIIGGTKELRGDHEIILDCEAVIVHNGQVSNKYLGILGEEIMKLGCDSKKLLHYHENYGPEKMIREIPGAYSMAIASKNNRDVVVMRDSLGIKPGVLGFKDGKCCVASEDQALIKNGADIIENLTPGSIYYLKPEGDYEKKKVIVDNKKRHCFFEWNYISEQGTVIDGISVRKVRHELGKELAKEYLFDDVDFVTFLPRCPEIAARAYSERTDLPFLPVFYKMRSERSFLGTTKEEREISIKQNLHLLPEIKEKNILKDKTIIIIDDSIVRGNNSKHAGKILYEEAEVKKVYFLSYTPKIGIIGKDGIQRGCEWGVDMPPEDNFIVKNKNDEEISEALGMITKFLSDQGMMNAFERAGMRNPREKLCYYCIGGERPC